MRMVKLQQLFCPKIPKMPRKGREGEEDSRIDPLACVEPGATIHAFCVICKDAVIGRETSIGHNVFIGEGVEIGRRCSVQGNCFIPAGVIIQDQVFIGPGVTFTNVKYPPLSKKNRGEYAKTVVCSHSSIGANATILPGIQIFPDVMIGAGAVVTHDCAPGLTYVGNPARPLTVRYFGRQR